MMKFRALKTARGPGQLHKTSSLDRQSSIHNMVKELEDEEGEDDAAVTRIENDGANESKEWKRAKQLYSLHVHPTLEKYSNLIYVIIFYIVGVSFYCNTEDWRFIEGMYFVTQTVSTVGYGNLVPTTPGGKVFIIFYVLIGILLIFSIINELTYMILIEPLKSKGQRENSSRKNKKEKIAKRKNKSKVAIIVRKTFETLLWFVLLFMLLIVGGGVLFANEEAEGTFETYLDAFYFAAMTACGVGYGDYVLVKDSSVSFNILFILVSVSLSATALDKAATLKSRIEDAEYEQQLDNLSFSNSLLNSVRIFCDTDHIRRSDYILYMLWLSRRIDQTTDIDPWTLRFDEFDDDNNGELDEKDVTKFKLNKAKMQIENDRKVVSGQRQNTVFREVVDELYSIMNDICRLTKDKKTKTGDSDQTDDASKAVENSAIERVALAQDLASMAPMPLLKNTLTAQANRRASAQAAGKAGSTAAALTQARLARLSDTSQISSLVLSPTDENDRSSFCSNISLLDFAEMGDGGAGGLQMNPLHATSSVLSQLNMDDGNDINDADRRSLSSNDGNPQGKPVPRPGRTRNSMTASVAIARPLMNPLMLNRPNSAMNLRPGVVRVDSAGERVSLQEEAARATSRVPFGSPEGVSDSEQDTPYHTPASNAGSSGVRRAARRASNLPNFSDVSKAVARNQSVTVAALRADGGSPVTSDPIVFVDNPLARPMLSPSSSMKASSVPTLPLREATASTEEREGPDGKRRSL